MKVRKPILLFTITLCLFSLIIVKSEVLAASTDTYAIYDITSSGYSAPTVDGNYNDAVWSSMANHTIPGWSAPYDTSWYKMVHDYGTNGASGYLYLLVFVKDATPNAFVNESSSHDWVVLQIGAGDSNMDNPSDAVFLQRGLSSFAPTYGCYEDGYFTGVGDSKTWVDGKSVSGFGSPGLGTQRGGFAIADYASEHGGWYFEAKIPLDSGDTSGGDADFISGSLLTTATWHFYWSYFDNEAGTGAGSHTGAAQPGVGSKVTFSLTAIPEFQGLTFLAVLIIATVAFSGFVVFMKKRKKLFQSPA